MVAGHVGVLQGGHEQRDRLAAAGSTAEERFLVVEEQERFLARGGSQRAVAQPQQAKQRQQQLELARARSFRGAHAASSVTAAAWGLLCRSCAWAVSLGLVRRCWRRSKAPASWRARATSRFALRVFEVGLGGFAGASDRCCCCFLGPQFFSEFEQAHEVGGNDFDGAGPQLVGEGGHGGVDQHLELRDLPRPLLRKLDVSGLGGLGLHVCEPLLPVLATAVPLHGAHTDIELLRYSVVAAVGVGQARVVDERLLPVDHGATAIGARVAFSRHARTPRSAHE